MDEAQCLQDKCRLQTPLRHNIQLIHISVINTMTASSNEKCENCIFFCDGDCKADKDRYIITKDGRREKLPWECDEEKETQSQILIKKHYDSI